MTKDLNERSSIFERIVNKLNEYYETNGLKHLSVKQVSETLENLDRKTEAKAGILEVKKLVS